MTSKWKDIGPGIVIAATGVGAGDLIAAAVGGARYGSTILWAAVIGALFKWVLEEGLARWQLATGTTILEGWATRLPKFVSIGFLIYLFFWGFIVAGALMAACGLAAHALYPGVPVHVWGAVHAVAAAVLVLFGRYKHLETIMKFLIGLMFVVIMVSAFRAAPPPAEVLVGLIIPKIPSGSIPFLLGVIGGVGGSVTLLSYGYWIRERGWTQPRDLPRVRLDVTVAYVLTGIFGVAIMVISAGVQPQVVSGSKMVLGVADHLGELAGPMARWLFLTGFWGAVFSSMLGVWQGVPYLFADYLNVSSGQDSGKKVDTRSKAYRFFLFYLAVPPMVLLLFDKPVLVVIIYAIFGALFMPFLAGLLLYMNSKRKWMGDLVERTGGKIMLALAVLLFLALFVLEVFRRLGG